MEIEVSKKVRGAIKAKLVELGCHVDDELPDYIMILIANRRSNQDMENDLRLFLTDNTKKFVNWLTHVLKKLEQVTASDAVPTLEKEAIVPEVAIGDAHGEEKIAVDGKQEKKEIKRKHSSSKSPTKKGKKPEKKERKLEKNVETTEQSLMKNEQIQEKTEKKSENAKQIVEKTDKSSEKVGMIVENQSSGKTEELNDGKADIASVSDQDPVSGKKKKLTIQRNDPMKTFSFSADKASEFISFESVKLGMDKKNNPDASAEAYCGHDTLILDTGENEFSENVDELRRIALESQERKRKDNEDKELTSKKSEPSSNRVHQRKLITSILMSRVNEDNDGSKSTRKTNRQISSTSEEKRTSRSSDKSSEYYGTRHSSRNSYSKSRRHDKSPVSLSRRVLRSPRRQERRSAERHYSRSEERRGRDNNREIHAEKSPVSVFSRIGNSSRKSRTRSRSPVRKLTSKIGNVILRSRSSSGDESPIRNSVSSVIKVKERPRRDLQLSNTMLLRAVADAQQSIIKSEQNSPVKPKPEEKVQDNVVTRDQSRKRMSDENAMNIEVVSYKKRFTEFPEVNSTDFYEEVDPTIRRISVKERLGVKRELRIPVRERLGLVQNHPHHHSPMHIYENEAYSPSSDYKIMINVSDEKSAVNGKQRNVVLATSDTKQRISIRVNNNSEEDDSSSDESMASTDNGPKKSTNVPLKNKDTYETDFQLAISDEDKLPEVPNDSEQEEYEEYEEIVEEVEDLKENEMESSSDVGTETPQELSQATTVDSHKERNFSITINKRAPPAPVALLKSNLPDLRSMMSTSKFPTPTANGNAGASGLKCKFWPKCQFKDKCMYEHPACKFSPCKNTDCIYKHENFGHHENFDSKPKPAPKLICKFYPKCTSMNCKFHHPSPCRFGVGCTDARCENYHPGVTLGLQKLKAKGVKLLPLANQLKWVKK